MPFLNPKLLVKRDGNGSYFKPNWAKLH